MSLNPSLQFSQQQLSSLNPQFPPSRYDARVTLCPSRPQLDLGLTWNTWKPTVRYVRPLALRHRRLRWMSDRRTVHLGMRPPLAGPRAPAAPQPPQGPSSSSSSSSSSGSSSVSRNWGLVQKVSDRREGGGVPSLPQPPPQLTSQGPAGLTSTGLAPAGVETSHPAALEDVDVPASASRAGAQHLRAQ